MFGSLEFEKCYNKTGKTLGENRLFPLDWQFGLSQLCNALRLTRMLIESAFYKRVALFNGATFLVLCIVDCLYLFS